MRLSELKQGQLAKVLDCHGPVPLIVMGLEQLSPEAVAVTVSGPASTRPNQVRNVPGYVWGLTVDWAIEPLTASVKVEELSKFRVELQRTEEVAYDVMAADMQAAKAKTLELAKAGAMGETKRDFSYWEVTGGEMLS
jgi:hypothetical protein